MAPKKRPAAAAAVKEEPSTLPKKQKQPAKAVSPVAKSPAKPAKAEVVEPPKPAKATAAKAPSPAPPPTGTGAKAKEPAKAGAAGKQQSYPAPSKEAWKDMRYQLQSLSKAGKAAHLHTRWAQQKTQSEKRTSTKEVHKESLQKQSELERRVEGWMTEWEVGKLEGADPTLPNFESLCKAAVVGLASRDHEVEAWARETVGQLEDEPFRQVEEALKVQALASYPASLQEKGREELKVEELQLAKSGCEKALKELNRALAPTKVW
ncbi:unnamed protein product, partial [Symbiodinium sp. CCMP2456]